MIMQLSRVALITLWKNASRVSVPLHHARMSAPETPQAAHSVAVAKPSTSDEEHREDQQQAGNELGGLPHLLRGTASAGRAAAALPGLSSDQPMM